MKTIYSYKIDIFENEIIELDINQIKFDIKTIHELLEKAETVDDRGSDSCTWQSSEYMNFLVRSRNALERIEKLIIKLEINGSTS